MYPTLDNNKKYGLTSTGFSIGDSKVTVRSPTIDRWTVNCNYIFRKYILISLNVCI
jgi:hypothetical protein